VIPISNSINNTPDLFCLNFRECDPKKCTASKLKNLNLIKYIKKVKGPLNKSIILTPFARKPIVLRYGLVVIDCSWKNIINLRKSTFKNARKLPPLIAANPTNYGKWEKLSSAEALAAALFITKFFEHGKLILSKFSWGIQFKELNKF
jgi:pre-rRNA-processing protein TSR3